MYMTSMSMFQLLLGLKLCQLIWPAARGRCNDEMIILEATPCYISTQWLGYFTCLNAFFMTFHWISVLFDHRNWNGHDVGRWVIFYFGCCGEVLLGFTNFNRSELLIWFDLLLKFCQFHEQHPSWMSFRWDVKLAVPFTLGLCWGK